MLSISTKVWNSVIINFITYLLLNKDYNRAVYDTVLITVNKLTKITYYTVMRKNINTFILVKLFLYKYIKLYRVFNNLIINWEAVFILKYWSFFYFYLYAQQNLITVFYLQINN